MSNRTWIGGAAAVAQVNTYTFTGTWEANDIIRVTIGTRTVSMTTGSTTIATITAALEVALQASTLPEFTEITWDSTATTVTATGVTAGVPFTATFAVYESDGTTPDTDALIGGAASTTGTATTACTGPNHADSAQNWTAATLPVNSDTIIFADSGVDCLYGLTGLSALTGITLKVYQSFTGAVGLPTYNAAGDYYEYRQRYLQLTGATLVEIGNGEGAGSSRLMFDFQATAITVANVYNSGSAESGEEVAVFLKGTHTSNVLNVNKGLVGVAVYPGEASALSLLTIGYRDNVAGDALVITGAGVTALTTIYQSGGIGRTHTNSTTLQMTDGEHIRLGTSTLTALNMDGGACRYQSNGALSAGKLGSGANLDLRQDTRGRTIAALEMYEGSELHDPLGTATFSSGIDLVRCAPADVVLDISPHQTLTLSAI